MQTYYHISKAHALSVNKTIMQTNAAGDRVMYIAFHLIAAVIFITCSVYSIYLEIT